VLVGDSPIICLVIFIPVMPGATTEIWKY
jgi:hypothetical protein